MADKMSMSPTESETRTSRREWERPSYAICDALEEQFEINWLEEPSLVRTVDLDAIDRFFEGCGDRSLSFEYADICITLSRKDGELRIAFD